MLALLNDREKQGLRFCPLKMDFLFNYNVHKPAWVIDSDMHLFYWWEAVMLALAISGAVIFWQIILGVIQLVGHGVGGRAGGAVAAILVGIWTVSQTGSELMAFQLVVQGIIAVILFALSGANN